MKNYKNITLNPNSTIKEALQIIDSGAMKLAIVLDENEKLIGTVTDGDIRRGLLGDLSLDDSIETIIFRTPTVCKIEDTKEKILEIAIEKKLYQIPIVDNDGKLVGIEEVDELLKATSKSNRVVLMVGGLGTRLYPLTKNTPKPMLKVGNKPILETIILNFKKYGFTNIILSVSYKSEVIEDYFGDGSKFGVNIEYVHEEQRMGTAGALSLMREKLNEPFFVMNGDLLTNINFEHMMEYHIQNNSIATMGVREYDFQVPYGVVNIDGIDIKSIEEKPVHNFFVSGGVYVLSAESLEYIPQNQYFDMPTLFEKIIADEQKSISFPIREYWLDIGRLEEFEKANNEYHEVF
ncbi:MAG: alcohol dehydrogenase [Sulfurimonas sp. RIFCSPLOWO2_12_36_12]|uniref:nucleotidyltransferase family protein n=1 Tax=Sulfurimonas sp. RIFCSPLOWO2_12_36_12 TaxID=1802253 RepID=UPI0008B835C8|nr:nucleotidyltransferase family protein [Sulfurimonas sp. RIFCSPLOWO2_12_36_12]OHE00536.1 MAG: alcohol dehydrogenase [Sulfurimonas sp. RIFCSPLOWO2_12_36_12]